MPSPGIFNKHFFQFYYIVLGLVIPAKAGIHNTPQPHKFLDTGLRRRDGLILQYPTLGYRYTTVRYAKQGNSPAFSRRRAPAPNHQSGPELF